MEVVIAMATLTWMVLVWCGSFLAPRFIEASPAPNGAPEQPNRWEQRGNGMRAGTERLGFQVWGSLDIPDLRFSLPQENPAVRMTHVLSFDEVSRRFLLRQLFTVPVAVETGTLSLNLQVEERTISQALWTPVADDRLTSIDRVSLRLAAKWEDCGKAEIEGSVSWRYDFTHGGQSVESVALSLKSMLPEVWLPWYLQGELCADSTRADQEALSLTAAYHDGDVARILTSLGVTRRDYSKGARQRQGSFILNTDCQWRYDYHLSVGIIFRYYLDEHSVESILYFQLGPSMRAP